MRFILFFVLLISITGYGQWKTYTIGIKGDTLNRVDMKGRKQGPWVIHVDELRGEKGYEEEGYFENDKKEGTWKRYSLDGDKIAEENYRWGNKNGKCSYYTNTGGLLREESWKAVNPDNPVDTVDVYDLHDPTKVIDRVAVRLTGFTLRHGLWTYYDPSEGTITKTERYWLDKLKTGNEEDDELKPIDVTDSKSKSDTTGKKKVTKPQAVLDYEKKNAGKKKVRTRDGQTGY
jgi:antitoxin component YwqK of YwqJK toxin-antitoxin module